MRLRDTAHGTRVWGVACGVAQEARPVSRPLPVRSGGLRETQRNRGHRVFDRAVPGQMNVGVTLRRE